MIWLNMKYCTGFYLLISFNSTQDEFQKNTARSTCDIDIDGIL